ncbi:hypothetical protein C1645_787112 [Glomus cerebriforme]|uniref:F-box domain-containing protein n=1 Tax=Glomus cerebriforme TaxID=658196 RepID=A0A397SAS4_9GLOM|nr:hypothetical protein C1645_787112 [Glomus cerebriforme]
MNQKSTLGLPSNLSLDSLREILGYFKNDCSTLYSLLFVNRLWCKIVVPLLWRQPFDMTSLENYDLIIQTYIYCLSEKEKSHFILAGVKLPYHPTPFFDYPTYLRSFDSDKFRQALNLWLKMNINESRFDPLNILCKPIKVLFGPMVKDRYNMIPRNILHKAVNKCIEPIVQDYYTTRPNFNVTKEMTRLLFSGCDKLRSLKICYDEDSLPLMEMIDSLCMKNVNALCNLQNFELYIRENLENEQEILENLFLTIARSATNIQHMKIDVPHEYKFPPKVHIALYTMISSQKNLSSYMSNYFWDSKFSIHSALKNRSLKRLNLWGLTRFDDSLIQGLLKWNNLETLELVGCPVTPMPCEPSCNKLNIKNLQLGNGYGNCPYIKTTLLQMCNTNLQKLTIEGVTSEILEEIIQHCPNITHLSLCAYQDISKVLPKLISSLHHLKVLTLGHHEKFLFTKSTIGEFVQSLPSSLKSLSLNFNISFDFLKILLEKNQLNLYKLELHQSQTYPDKFINFLSDYAKNQTQIKLYIPPEHSPIPKKMSSLSTPLEIASIEVLKRASKHINIYYKLDNKNFYNLW